MTIRSWKKLLAAVGGVVLACGTASTSYGAVIANFAPDPTVAGFYEAQYQPSGSPAVVQLTENLNPATGGATGNHDVNTAGGLRIETPFASLDLSPGGPSYNVGYAQNSMAGTTSFFDVSLHLTGLTPSGSAQVSPSLPYNTISQWLNDGTFQLQSYSPTGSPEILLLQGQIKNGFVYGFQGQQTGGLISADVTYTGGKIYDALAATTGVTSGTPINGTLAWSLTTTSVAGYTVTGSTLNAFTANMTGHFDAAIPEPATVGMLAIGGVLVMLRRRR